MKNTAVQRLSHALGWAGVLPFAALSLASAFPTTVVDAQRALGALTLYGAAILSFLGGVTWGLTLAREGQLDPQSGVRGLVVSNGASLAACGATLLPVALGLPLLMTGFVAMLVYDLRNIARGLLPAWYRPLRTGLSAVAVASLGLALLRA
jgi:hypothetical protein